jgi:hypothetical protein
MASRRCPLLGSASGPDTWARCINPLGSRVSSIFSVGRLSQVRALVVFLGIAWGNIWGCCLSVEGCNLRSQILRRHLTWLEVKQQA